MGEGRRYRLAFVLGQTLGNAMFASNLRSVVKDDADVAASWYFVDYPPRRRGVVGRRSV